MFHFAFRLHKSIAGTGREVEKNMMTVITVIQDIKAAASHASVDCIVI